MRIAELVLKYVQALVWPATALAITFLFRQQLRQILLRLTRVEAAGASMEFAAETNLLSLEAQAVEATLPTPSDADAEEAEAGPWSTFEDRPWHARLSWIRSIRHLTPQGAVTMAREEVIKEFEDLTHVVFASATPAKVRQTLTAVGLGPETIGLYERFMRLSDTSRIEGLTPLSAEDLVDAAEILLRALSEVSPT